MNIFTKLSRLFIVASLFIASTNTHAQVTDSDVLESHFDDNTHNPIYTALPFLMIAPDSRGGGMGEVGAATTPDLWSMHWNASKYAFIENEMGAGISYTPWLRNLGVKDINLGYATGYYKLDKFQTVAAGIRFFSMGNIQFRDENGNDLGSFEPKEFTFDLAYARKLSENFALSIAGRYINSNLTGGYSNDGSETKPARSVASDVSGYYTKDTEINQIPAEYSFGFNVSNIGAKVGYSEKGAKDFLPTNLKLGAGLRFDTDIYNSIGIYADVNKLLVPTPPLLNEGEIIAGKDNDVPVVTGIFQSFNDAPGGTKEELEELQYSFGAEYWYDKQFALRGGYYTENATKGNRKFMQFGIGLKMNVFGLDLSYLVPTKGQNSPLAKTFRFSLTFDFEGLSNENGETDI